MRKNLLVLVCALCICSLTFAQISENQKVKVSNSEFMNKIKKGLEDPNNKVSFSPAWKFWKSEGKVVTSENSQFILIDKLAKSMSPKFKLKDWRTQ